MTDKALNYEENVVYDYAYDYEKPKNDDRERKMKDAEKSEFCDQMIGGMVLVSLGSYFLLKALGISLGFSWLTMLMIIIGGGLMMKAVRAYLRLGYVPKDFKEQAGGGSILLLIGMIFLLNLSWSVVLPLFLIIPGVVLLLGGDDD